MLRFGTIKRGDHILIVGASGELGAALALVCAAAGASLSLWGRDSEKLERISTQSLAAGASAVSTRLLDLRSLDAALHAIAVEDEARPFTIALFAAGVGDVRGQGECFEDAQLVARVVSINFLAPSALGSMLARRMAARKHGRIALIGSAASFHALPFAAAYASSKAGLARFADAMRIAMRPHGVTVTLVSPGFIDTAAAHRVPGPKPFMLSSERAARAVIKATMQGKGHVTVPWPFAVLRLIVAAIPRVLRDPLLRSLAPTGQ